MATKSFTTDFKFTKKNGAKLINAIESSRSVKLHITKPTHNATSKEEIQSIMDSFLRGAN